MAHITSIEQLSRDEGRVEAIITVLESRFEMTPAGLREKLLAQPNDALIDLTRRAAVADTLKEFLEHV